MPDQNSDPLSEQDKLLRELTENLGDALAEIATARMPFGKYGPQNCPPNGVPIYDLPPEYLLWFKQKGFPSGKLGRLLAVVCEIKANGAEAVFEPMREAAGGRTVLRPPRKKSWDFPNDE